MGDASYTQTSFLAGELSQFAQGQFDKPYYKMGLNRASNIWPSDEGAAPRRPGTRTLGVSNKGKPARLISFDFSQQVPYNLEFSDNAIRMWNDTALVTTNDSQTVVSVSSADPAVFALGQTVNWKTGDAATFAFSTPQAALAGAAVLNRQVILTMLSTTTFTAVDAITGAAVGTVDNIAGKTPIVNHVLQIATPYNVLTNDWHSTRFVQGYNLGLLLHSTVAPQALAVLNPPTNNSFATFSYSTAQFQDGPYLDPPANSVATPASLSTSTQITVGYPAWSNTTIYGFGVLVSCGSADYVSLINNNATLSPASNPAAWLALPSGSMVNSGKGFVLSDVGRMIRLFSQPQIWSPGTTYASGDSVTYNGEYFNSLAGSNTNNQPDISVTDWVINPSGAIWTWGFITVVNSANNVTVQIQGAPLLYQAPILVWRLGAWSNTTGWPTCGCYQGGRFWFGGAIPNRVDAAQPNQPFNMAPTLQDGTVADNNAITYTFNSTQQNPIFWMTTDHDGILIGTQEREFLLVAGSGGVITPSNIKEAPETKYGSANILPVRTGLTICFVKRYSRRIYEYLADVFSGRFFGSDLTQYARHLGSRIIEELAYQEELIPTVWGRCADGSLIGATYRRNSLFSTQPPEFVAWHQHALGSGRTFESICVGPSVGGTLDALSAVTNDPSTDIRFVEQMTSLLDETASLTQSWFLDTAITPPIASSDNANITFYGLAIYNGKTVSVFAAGIDCGDYVVTNGQVSVPLNTADAVTGATLSLQNIQILQPMAAKFSNLSVNVIFPTAVYQIPCVIGFNYESQGQICRPQLPQETGAKNGPGFGKKRRSARYALQLVNSIGVRVGTDFNNMKPAPLTKVDAGGKNLKYLDMFSGIIRETLENDYSYDSMLAWNINRPYPTTVIVIGGFIQTADI